MTYDLAPKDILDFEERWFKRAKEIESGSLSSKEGKKILSRFKCERNKAKKMLRYRFGHDPDISDILERTETEIELAVSKAVSRQQETKKGGRGEVTIVLVIAIITLALLSYLGLLTFWAIVIILIIFVAFGLIRYVKFSKEGGITIKGKKEEPIS